MKCFYSGVRIKNASRLKINLHRSMVNGVIGLSIVNVLALVAVVYQLLAANVIIQGRFSKQSFQILK